VVQEVLLHFTIYSLQVWPESPHFAEDIYLASLASLALYHVTQPKLAEKHTNTVGTPHITAQCSSDSFSLKLHKKRNLLLYYYKNTPYSYSAVHQYVPLNEEST
jgi:hypothetical protein